MVVAAVETITVFLLLGPRDMGRRLYSGKEHHRGEHSDFRLDMQETVMLCFLHPNSLSTENFRGIGITWGFCYLGIK